MPIEIQKTNPYTTPQTYQLKMENWFALTEPYTLSGNIVDVEKQEIFMGRVHVLEGKIKRIERCVVPEVHYIMPGFVCAHSCINSAVQTPFLAVEAARYGIVAEIITVADECVDICEAEEKIRQGENIIITTNRFDVLYPLINQYPSATVLATNDCTLSIRTYSYLLDTFQKGMDKGLSFFNLLRVISSNIINHYHLSTGLLREGDAADFIVVDNLTNLTVKQTYINGKLIYDDI